MLVINLKLLYFATNESWVIMISQKNHFAKSVLLIMKNETKGFIKLYSIKIFRVILESKWICFNALTVLSSAVKGAFGFPAIS